MNNWAGAGFGGGGTLLASLVGWIDIVGLGQVAVSALVATVIGFFATRILNRIFKKRTK